MFNLLNNCLSSTANFASAGVGVGGEGFGDDKSWSCEMLLPAFLKQDFIKIQWKPFLSVKSIAPPPPPCYVQQTLCMIFLRYRVQVHIQWAYSICIRFKAVLHLDLPQVVLSQEEKRNWAQSVWGSTRSMRPSLKVRAKQSKRGEHNLFHLQEIELSDLSLARSFRSCFYELVFQRIRRLTKMNYFLHFASFCDDLTHLSLPLKLNFS